MKQLVFLLSLILIITSCSGKKEKESQNSADSTGFCIPDSLMDQITLDTVKVKPVYNELKLIGKVTYDQDKVVRIYPLVSGIVTDVRVSLGSYVEKGQVLAVIKSSEVAGAENELTAAKTNLAVAEKSYASATDMYKSGILSEKDYAAATADYEKAKSEYQKTSTVISIYGGGSQSDYVVRAPISGFIVEKFVNPNMQIRPDNSTNLFTLSDLRKVWVLANVYESDIDGIKEGENADVTTITYDDKVFHGKIDKVYNFLDPDNKTMKVQIQLDNPGYMLKPEMFATVKVRQLTRDKMLAVPAGCVIFDRNRYWALVYKDKCHIETRQLDILTSNSVNSYVQSGVSENERVITNRQLLLYDAINQ